MRFEIRIPTYERPILLLRALQSLQAQTHRDWRAVVFDDSQTPDAARIVADLKDGRLKYVKNQNSIGAAQNIDQCFSSVPSADAEFGCLLEDDNYWLPGFLSLISQRLADGRWNIVLANQRINCEGSGLLPPNETTRGHWFAEGKLSPLQLRASLLLMEGISNGGLVWRLTPKVHLQVGSSVKETGLHEACRTLLIQEDILFISEAQAVWTELPDSMTARASTRYRVIGRGMQAIRDFVLKAQGAEAVQIATKSAVRNRLIPSLAFALAYSGHPIEAFRVGGKSSVVGKALRKGFAIRFAESNPCRAFLGSLSEREQNSTCGPSTVT